MTDPSHDHDNDPTALVFPGQGSQAPGMGKLVYENSEAARRVFDEASEVVGIDLKAVCFDTNADDLADTSNTQPAVLTTSIAFLEAMREKLAEVGHTVQPRLFGGHSLGLFSAAVAANALSFRDALKLIVERARLMGTLNEERPVGMAAILGLDADTVRTICADATTGDDSRVDVANHNDDTQTVISGDVSALERAMEAAQAVKGKAIRLKVKVSSHTPLSIPQADEFAHFLRDVTFADPVRPIVSNITSDLLRTAADVRAEFEAQLRSPVLWADNVRRMTNEGVTTFIEVGPGHLLARMIKRIAGDEVEAISLDDARDQPIPISILPQQSAS